MDSLVYIGLMSGTSVDGLDICAVKFEQDKFSFLATDTYVYSDELHTQLLRSHLLSSVELAQLHVDFGIFCGDSVKSFVKKHHIHADYVCSHGQTVFHTPHSSLTLQIGSGAHIAAKSGITTICDFRTLDVAMGGQGAPLVPIGDELLFSEYNYCLNIGGFANVSTNKNKKRIAWDICPANIVLNSFAREYGKDYDFNGELGQKGFVDNALLSQLNELKYYKQEAPKSLGREWTEENILPIFEKSKLSNLDKMATYYEHCAIQIGKILQGKETKTLCTGGGIKNQYLVKRIAQYAESQLVIPDENLIDYKEALIFAYLGYLRVNKQANCLASVTGARKNVCGGAIYLAN